MHVLLVEDDASLREGLSELLEDLCTVHPVGTLGAALEAFTRRVYDLVVTDLRIGEEALGGGQVIAAAHAQLCPAVLVTGSAVSGAPSDLSALGAEVVLGKPFTVEEVLAVTERFAALFHAVARAPSEAPGCRAVALNAGEPLCARGAGEALTVVEGALWAPKRTLRAGEVGFLSRALQAGVRAQTPTRLLLQPWTP